MTSHPNPCFTGFQEDNQAPVRVPQAFFAQLLPKLDSLSQLQLLLYLFWHADQQQNKIHQFRLEDLSSDPTLIQMVGNKEALQQNLESLTDLGILLKSQVAGKDKPFYFINNPQGQAAVIAIENGEWQDAHKNHPPIHLIEEKPNIFKLYEENIGVITPMMAEILKDDELAYPAWWIEKAIKIAVTRNVRTWKYVQGILKRWQKEGFGDEQYRRDDSQDPENYRKNWLKRD